MVAQGRPLPRARGTEPCALSPRPHPVRTGADRLPSA